MKSSCVVNIGSKKKNEYLHWNYSILNFILKAHVVDKAKIEAEIKKQNEKISTQSIGLLYSVIDDDVNLLLVNSWG